MIQDDMVEFEAHSAKTCNFVICGDFNARTAELPDYVEHDNHQAKYLKVLKFRTFRYFA